MTLTIEEISARIDAIYNRAGGRQYTTAEEIEIDELSEMMYREICIQASLLTSKKTDT